MTPFILAAGQRNQPYAHQETVYLEDSLHCIPDGTMWAGEKDIHVLSYPVLDM